MPMPNHPPSRHQLTIVLTDEEYAAFDNALLMYEATHPPTNGSEIAKFLLLQWIHFQLN